MSRTQLVSFEEPRWDKMRLDLTENARGLHPGALDIPEGASLMLLGSDALLRLAVRLTSDPGRYRLATIDVRDESWRSSDESEEVAQVTNALLTSIRERNHRAIEQASEALRSGMTLESIELSEVDTGRRLLMSKLGSIETQVANAEEDQRLLADFVSNLNEVAT